MRVTDKERAIFEEIRQKMLAEQDEAMQDFATLMANPVTQEFRQYLADIQARCTTGSVEAVQVGNILLVLDAVTQQFPLKEQQEAPTNAEAPAE